MGQSVGMTEARTPRFDRRIPAGDDRSRLVCRDCGFVAYENPRVVVGSVVTWEDRILLCRRAIEPRAGFWTLPAGFLEMNESAEEGARREAWEEARARIEIDALLAVYDLVHRGQLQLMFRARLLDANVSAGPESREVALVPWEEIPWSDLAFASVRWALHHHRELRGERSFPPRRNPAGEGGDLPGG